MIRRMGNPGRISQPLGGSGPSYPPGAFPAFVSAAVPAAGATVVAEFTALTAPLLPATGVTGFTVKLNGLAATISSTARTASTQLTITMAGPILPTDVVLISYTPGNVTDTLGRPLQLFTDQAVTNNSTATIMTMANLAQWLRADAGVFSDAGVTPAINGDPVQQWSDQSGGNRHVLQGTLAARPTYVTGARNSLPAIRYDGVDDGMITSSGALSPINNQTAYTVIIVMINSGGAGARAPLWTSEDRFTLAGNNNTWYQNATPTTISSGTQSSFSVYALVWNGTTRTSYKDGTQVATQDPTSVLLSTASYAVGRTQASHVLGGDVCEHIVIQRGIASFEFLQIQTYLKAKWATP